MAASDYRPKCKVCGAITQSNGEGRVIDSRPRPIEGEQPRRRAQALKIRKRNDRKGAK